MGGGGSALPPAAQAAMRTEDTLSTGAPGADAAAAGGGKPPAAKKGADTGPKTYKRVEMPTPDQIAMDDLMNNCVVKTVMATVMGSVLGAAMGIFFGAFEPMAPGDEKLSVVQSLKNAGRTSLQKAGSYAKGFAVFGALYSGSECVIEQTRARHDIYNSAGAGCFTGGVMARSSGPSGMAMGCATMGALSVCMDKFMDLH